MKTRGMKHQLEALRRMNGREFYGLFCEQGTGKTWILIADAERLYAAGKIDAMFIVAPKGVHTNWVLRELPKHCSMPFIARAWKSGAGKYDMKKINELLTPRDIGTQPPMRILAMNIDALNTKAGLEFAKKFLLCTKSYFAVDECFVAGTKIATPTGSAPIENLKNGDNIIGQTGPQRIKRVLKNLAEHLCSVHLSDGTTIKTTENHPFFTEVGWVCANSLAGHEIFNYEKVRVLRQSIPEDSDQEILQQILFSEMEDETTERAGSRLLERKKQETFEGADGPVQRQNSLEQRRGNAKENARQSVCFASEDESQTANPWWERAFNEASNSFTEYLGTTMGDGIRHPHLGRKAIWLSGLLQGRFSLPKKEMGNRGGRLWSRGNSSEGKRQKENGKIAGVRVVGVEIKEQRSIVYNLEIEGCPHYYAEGCLVHNSSRIKTPTAGRAKAIMELKPHAAIRRIATGTPITNSPMDVFSQFEFLEEGLLGTTSYRAFTAEYAELMDSSNPMMKKMIQNNPRIAFAQIVARDEDGNKKWRNLDKLQVLMAPHSFRVLKKDCLDLPQKIYQQSFFDLTPAQGAAYKLMEDEFRLALEDDELETFKALNSITKLQQITSGFVMRKDKSIHYVEEDNPRLAALVDLLEDFPGKVIVWGRFREELRAIASALSASGHQVVEYHGGIKSGEEEGQRDWAVDQFQNGKADVFVGQPQSGGIGLTLTAAEMVVYYSNDYNLETRLQSEDRAHRIGQRKHVVYLDLVARGTIDEPIAAALQRKADVAALILGDNKNAFFSNEKEAA